MSYCDLHQFCLFNKTVSKLGIAEWKHPCISKSFRVSEFGKVEITSTPAESSFFRALSLLKLYTGLQYHIYSDFRQTSKNFEGGLPKHILEKNTVFWKKGVEVWAFDGKYRYDTYSMFRTGRQDPLRQLSLLYLTKNSIKGCSKSPSRADNYLSRDAN